MSGMLAGHGEPVATAGHDSARRSALDLIATLRTGPLIAGRWRQPAEGRTFSVLNPADGTTLAQVTDGDRDDATRAITAAAAAQRDWARSSPRERADVLMKAYDLIMERRAPLAALMTAEMGKPLAEASGEVTYAADYLRWFAEEAVRISGELSQSPDGAGRVLVTKGPVGPCILVTPWNFPLAMGARKIGPALAAGCTIVFKPADLTPLSSLALAAILQEAGLPDGVLNVVCTTDPGSVVSTWIDSGLARKISFTGSTGVGIRLLEQAATQVMRTSMELGGNAPLVVFDDADVDRAVDGILAAKMRNMGEACTAANRIYVQRGIAPTIAELVTQRFSTLTVGDGFDSATDVGPLINQRAVEKVERLVADAVDHGARVTCGGRAAERVGTFFEPTVLTDVPTTADLLSEEIFGPVAPIIPFDTEEQVIASANDTPWGLTGYVFTQDVDRLFRVAEALEVGMVGLNTGLVANPAAPFGGIKASGLGREGGRVGIEEFLDTKYLAMSKNE